MSYNRARSSRSGLILERFLFGKTENWIVLLLLTAGLGVAVLFGAVVQHRAEGNRGLDTLGDAAVQIASFPRSVLDVFHALSGHSPSLVTEQRFEGQSGLEVLADGGGWRDTGYLLLARYDGDRETSVVELFDLGRRKAVHVWTFDPEAVAAKTGDAVGAVRNGRMYPYVLSDGFLLFVTRDHFLVMLDGCSSVQWVLDSVSFHHSVERDADGHFWVPYDMPQSLVPGVPSGFNEDGLARVSRSGKILSLIPLSPSLFAGGHQHLMYSPEDYVYNPMHMNDIQPVLQDGPWWRRDDLFVSLRTRSVVLLYRPSTDDVIWLRSGPWLHQHDVNVISDHEISILSNNAAVLGNNLVETLYTNEVFVYDMATGDAGSPWRDALLQHDVRTPVEGRATVLGNGDVFVEETAHGRALRVAADGTLRWSYVNRAADGQVYRLSWSRYLDEEEGAGVASAVAALDCTSE